MLSRDKAQALFYGTLTLGAAAVAVAAARGGDASLATLALLGAAVVATELIEVPSDEHSLDPMDAHPFSFSSSVHIAAVLIAGPWAAALVAAFGVLAVDSLRGARWRQVAFNASVFAVASASAGLVFEGLGGVPGALELPSDYGALAALALAYYLANTLLVSAIIAFTSGSALSPLALETFRHGLPSAAGETGLAVAFALRVVFQPWAILALVPLVFAVYQAHARLAILRRETARALETFANVVDERDPSTFRHSARVAEHVRRLAQALGLPASEVARVRWAGRLHDLGKIGVDAAVLRKPAKLDDDEWASMRRHPRLSARLLRRFRFAAGEARAVEYHHERYDGIGYYGVDPAQIPLAAHFLIVCDTFDAMTSDRPYRKGLPRDVALAEIEAGAGSQFHPAVARAFVALQRGVDPATVLTPGEAAELRRLTLRQGGWPGQAGRFLLVRLEVVAAVCLAGALFAVGLGSPPAAVATGLAALAALGWRGAERARARHVRAALLAAVGEAPGPAALGRLADELAAVADLRWAGLVAWRRRDLHGSILAEWGEAGAAPSEAALTSWLIREAEEADGVLVVPGAELGSGGRAACVPLGGDESLAGYVVLLFDPKLPHHVELALGGAICGLAAAFSALRPDPSGSSHRRLAPVP